MLWHFDISRNKTKVKTSNERRTHFFIHPRGFPITKSIREFSSLEFQWLIMVILGLIISSVFLPVACPQASNLADECYPFDLCKPFSARNYRRWSLPRQRCEDSIPVLLREYGVHLIETCHLKPTSYKWSFKVQIRTVFSVLIWYPFRYPFGLSRLSRWCILYPLSNHLSAQCKNGWIHEWCMIPPLITTVPSFAVEAEAILISSSRHLVMFHVPLNVNVHFSIVELC